VLDVARNIPVPAFLRSCFEAKQSLPKKWRNGPGTEIETDVNKRLVGHDRDQRISNRHQKRSQPKVPSDWRPAAVKCAREGYMLYLPA
jgi:hypothetical protein